MWTSADEYCERMTRKEERIKQLCEKYKQSDNEEIKEIIDYLLELDNKYTKCEAKETEYFKKSNKYECEAGRYKKYSKELEKELKRNYDYRYKEDKQRGEILYNRKIQFKKEECMIRED